MERGKLLGRIKKHMANRRMFSKTITSSSKFLMMPNSAQNLYFHLGMNADDDGFCEHFSIMRMTESKPDDLKILQAKGFVNIFDDKVLVILDWKENNYLRTDRYTPSKYLEEYRNEMALLSQNSKNMTLGIPDGNQMDTEVRLGKDRLGKEKKKEIAPQECGADVQKLIKMFEPINPSYERLFSNKTQRKALERMVKKHGLEKLTKAIEFTVKSNGQPYSPTICTPLQLETKFGALQTFYKKTFATGPKMVTI